MLGLHFKASFGDSFLFLRLTYSGGSPGTSDPPRFVSLMLVFLVYTTACLAGMLLPELHPPLPEDTVFMCSTQVRFAAHLRSLAAICETEALEGGEVECPPPWSVES